MQAEKRCKHSLIEGQCALCKGLKQSRVRQTGDNPSWFRTPETLGRGPAGWRNLDSAAGHLAVD
jgi:hypothetical protein